MKVLIIQHVDFENPGYFRNLFEAMNAEIAYLNFFEAGYRITQEFDLLLIMGGPMNIYEEEKYPWLKEEKALSRNALEKKKMIIGVCLGSQLIADALGKRIYRIPSREIGWFPVRKTHEEVLNFLPEYATVFHWHGESYDIPEACTAFYGTDLTPNQSFLFDNRVLALQFHMEMTPEGAEMLIENCRDELDGTSYVMSPEMIMEGFSRYRESNKKMLRNLVNWLVEKNGFGPGKSQN